MNLMPMAPLLAHAVANGYGQGAFNATCWPQVKGMLEIHEMLQSPAILQVGNLALGYLGNAGDMRQSTVEERKRGAENVLKMIRSMAEKLSIPVAVHADHIMDFDTAKALVDVGFTSVMIDGSHLSYDDNIELTRSVVVYAHRAGVTVEAELGTLEGMEDDVFSENSTYTNPLLVADFLKKTEADCLAISYGTQHGPRKGKDAKLRYEIVTASAENLRHAQIEPLIVSHGSSTVPEHLVEEINLLGGNLTNTGGISFERLQRAIQAGVSKINVDTDVRLNVTRNIRAELSRPENKAERLYDEIRALLAGDPGEIDFRRYLSPIRNLLIDHEEPVDRIAGRMMTCVENGTREAVGVLISRFGSASQAHRLMRWYETKTAQRVR